MKKIFAVFVAILMVASVSAQADEISTGMVDATSPFYGLEIALDNAAISFGVTNASKVALERAAEARSAAEQNNSRAVQRAAAQFDRMAQNRELVGLQKARRVLNQAMEKAPAEAQQGLQTAMDSLGEAMDRAGGVPGGAGPNGTAPDMNGSAPDMDGSSAGPGTTASSTPANGSQ